MAEKPKKKKRNLKEAEAVEVHDDAWERFESTVKRIVPGKPDKAKGGSSENDGQDSSNAK